MPYSNEIHEAYGGGTTPITSELVPGEISHGCPEKWWRPGIVVACLGLETARYVYDPELLIYEGAGDPISSHVVWRSKNRGGHTQDGSGWQFVNITKVGLAS
jgi:hypothetical protein